VRFFPRLRFSAFPGRGRLTTPGSGEHKVLPLTEGQPGIFPTSRVTGVDSDCTHDHWQSQQRESYQHSRTSDCYPSLAPLADKEQIFSRQSPTVISSTSAIVQPELPSPQVAVLALSPLKEDILVATRGPFPYQRNAFALSILQERIRNGGIFAVSSTTPKPTGQEEGDTRAKAFEQAYKETHPNGPYLRVEPKPRPKEGLE